MGYKYRELIHALSHCDEPHVIPEGATTNLDHGHDYTSGYEDGDEPCEVCGDEWNAPTHVIFTYEDTYPTSADEIYP